MAGDADVGGEGFLSIIQSGGSSSREMGKAAVRCDHGAGLSGFFAGAMRRRRRLDGRVGRGRSVSGSVLGRGRWRFGACGCRMQGNGRPCRGAQRRRLGGGLHGGVVGARRRPFGFFSSAKTGRRCLASGCCGDGASMAAAGPLLHIRLIGWRRGARRRGVSDRSWWPVRASCGPGPSRPWTCARRRCT